MPFERRADERRRTQRLFKIAPAMPASWLMEVPAELGGQGLGLTGMSVFWQETLPHHRGAGARPLALPLSHMGKVPATVTGTGLTTLHDDQACTGLAEHTHRTTREASDLERETGIEPASLAWKARVLPLNYSRPGAPRQLPCGGFRESKLLSNRIRRCGGGGWIRTSVLVRGQIYSLLPLTTRPPLRSELGSIHRQKSADNGSAHESS